MKKARVWIGLCLLAFSVWLFVKALSYTYITTHGPGPGFFPRWLSLIFMALSLVLIIQSLLDKNDICLADFFPGGKHLTEVLTVFVSIVVFIFGSKLLGYLAANTLMMLILTLNKLKWYRSLIVSFGVSVILYVLFHEILLLRLPVGILGF